MRLSEVVSSSLREVCKPRLAAQRAGMWTGSPRGGWQGECHQTWQLGLSLQALGALCWFSVTALEFFTWLWMTLGKEPFGVKGDDGKFSTLKLRDLEGPGWLWGHTGVLSGLLTIKVWVIEGKEGTLSDISQELKKCSSSRSIRGLWTWIPILTLPLTSRTDPFLKASISFHQRQQELMANAPAAPSLGQTVLEGIHISSAGLGEI